MSGRIQSILWPFILAVISVVSCSAPSETENFIKASEKDEYSRYCFDMDMSDSLSSYDIGFYFKIDCSDREFAEIKDIPLEITFMSPSGRAFSENAYIPKDSVFARSAHSKEYKALYRSGAVPVEAGVWRMYVRVPGEDRIKGFRGIGVKTERYGKR